MSLSEIEAVKTHTFNLNLTNLTTTNPITLNYTKDQIFLSFLPDFVKVKCVSIFDYTNSSVGIYDVHANFIKDQSILASITSLPITVSNQMQPDLLHQFINTNQLQFRIMCPELQNSPSAIAYISITLEFVKLKKLVLLK